MDIEHAIKQALLQYAREVEGYTILNHSQTPWTYYASEYIRRDSDMITQRIIENIENAD